MIKNKIWLMAIICSVLSAVLFGCVKREIRNVNSKGKNIICFGDSVTFGYGAENGQDYPAQLSKMLGMPVINCGIDGDTSIEGLKRIDSDVLQRVPRLVLIEFGGNDFLRKIPIEVTAGNIKTMIDKVQAAGAMAAIVDVSAGMFLRDYRVLFSKISKEKNVIFIPSVLNNIITTPGLKSDFFHPNSKGYNLVAQRVYRGVSLYLKKSTPL